MKRLEEKELEKYFGILWGNTNSSLFKLETKQVYSDDELYKKYVNTKYENFNKLFQKIENIMLSEQSDLWKEATARHINIIRVHIIDLPLTEYMQYEILTYKISQKYNEKIRLMTREEAEKLGISEEIEDFLLFDDNNLIIHYYDDKGNYDHSVISEESDDLSKYIQVKKKLLTSSMNLNKFMATYDLINNY